MPLYNNYTHSGLNDFLLLNIGMEKLLRLAPAEIYKVIINGKLILVLRVFNSRTVFEERITSCTEVLLYSNSLFLCTAELRRVFNK